MTRDIFYILGVLLIGVGAGAFDWRVGLIVTGSVLLATAAAAMRKGRD